MLRVHQAYLLLGDQFGLPTNAVQIVCYRELLQVCQSVPGEVQNALCRFNYEEITKRSAFLKLN